MGGVFTNKSIVCDFNLIIADITNIRNINESVKMAGYKVKNLILQPVASAEAVVDEEEKTAGVCLVDIGGGTTDIAIYHEGVLRYTSVLQLAGDVITDDIKDGCNIIRTQAEILKQKYGSCIANPKEQNEIISIPGFKGQAKKEIKISTLSEIINARVKLILELVLLDIKNAGYDGNKLIAGVVLTGGGAMIKNIKGLTEFVTGISTRIGESDSNIAKLSSDNMDIKHPMYATGVGLVIKGFEYYEENDNPITEQEADNKEGSQEDEIVKPKEVKHKSKEKGLLATIRQFLDNLLSNGVQ